MNLLLILAVLLLWSNKSMAADITATTCSEADVSTAISSAADGDRVLVPAGSCNWTDLLISNKSIQIIGAGIGVTTITSTGAPASYGNGAIFTWTLKATGNTPAGYSRMSGFTFKATGGSSGYAGGSMITFAGRSNKLQFDHNRIELTSTSGIQTWDKVNGVIDHNELVNVSANGNHLIQATHSNWSGTELTNSCGGGHGCGDSSWAADETFGTEENLYIEDNTLKNQLGHNSPNFGGYCVDDRMGSRTIYRFNNVIDCAIQTHGTETSGRERGSRYLVTMRNVFSWTEPNTPSVIANRGGGGRHWDNVVTGNVTAVVDTNTYRYNDDYDASGHQGSYPWGRCGNKTVTSMTRSGSTVTVTFPSGADGHYSNSGGSYQTFSGAVQSEYNGTFKTYAASDTTITFTVAGTPATPATGTITMSSPFDTADAGYTGGFRCLDQAGAGKSVLFQGSGPNDEGCCPPAINVETGNSALEPILVSNNTEDGVVSNLATYSLPVVASDRDYYDHNASCTGGSCTGGIGRGTSLPTACTPTSTSSGPYYVLTNAGTWNAPGSNGAQDTGDADGVFYKCAASNTWTAFWTPYQYPHALVSSGGGGSTASTSITAPTAGSTQSASTSFAVSGTAVAGNGSLSNVSVYVDGVLACQDTVTPWTSWTCNVTAPASAGTYTLTAKATDADGQGPASTGVSFTVPSTTPKKLRLRKRP